jgi:UDP-glucose 4-epimerase
MIIITGVAGFIGSNLAEELLNRGKEVVGVDILDNYYDISIKMKNLEKLKNYKKFKFIKDNAGNIDKKLLENAEIVYHEAGIGGVRYSIDNPKKYFKLNVVSTFNLLVRCLDTDIKKFVFASSSSVYGNYPEKMLPLNESYECRPISPYGCSKLAAEQYCMNFYKVYGLFVISLRYFTVYGPRQRPDEAICKFTKKILKNDYIEIHGDGKQTRDFTYVTDVVKGTILAGESKIKGEIFNIGSGNRISILDLVKLIENTLGNKAKVKHTEWQKGDVMHTQADISKARKVLNYQPNYMIENGIKKYVEWLRDENIINQVHDL